MADINDIKTDINKEVEGVWVDFASGIRLKIARARNPKYTELLQSLVEPIKLEVRNGKIDAEKFAEILFEVRAKTILLDWKNIEENGVEVPYSSEKAMEYFKNPELKDFYNFVIIISENADQYKKKLIEDAEKNL
jgi:hypothetical protein